MATKVGKNFLIALFLFGWILPVGYYGFTNSTPPWVPEFLAQRANVSRLFYRESFAWWIYEIQYKIGVESDFRIWDERDRFQMRPFGYRTRFQRLIAKTSTEFRESLVQSIRKDIDSRGDLNSPVREIRIIRFPYQAQENSKLIGHFIQPNSAGVKEKEIEIVTTYDFDPNN